MILSVNRLAEKDFLKLEALNELFGKVFDDQANYHKNKPTKEYLASFLRNNEHIVIVAELDNKIIGGLVAYTLNKFEQNRKELYVYDLAVADDFQRKGVGKKLMEEIRRIAKQTGAYVVFVQADEGDEAIHFYESLQPTENARTRNFDFDINAS